MSKTQEWKDNCIYRITSSVEILFFCSCFQDNDIKLFFLLQKNRKIVIIMNHTTHLQLILFYTTSQTMYFTRQFAVQNYIILSLFYFEIQYDIFEFTSNGEVFLWLLNCVVNLHDYFLRRDCFFIFTKVFMNYIRRPMTLNELSPYQI